MAEALNVDVEATFASVKIPNVTMVIIFREMCSLCQGKFVERKTKIWPPCNTLTAVANGPFQLGI